MSIPIGNLTSQIFANIYLNELDRFVSHNIRPLAYLRYGDDFIILSNEKSELQDMRARIREYLKAEIRLDLHEKNDILVKSAWGIRFLGVRIFPNGRRLNRRNFMKTQQRLERRTAASYRGLVQQHMPTYLKEFDWLLLERFEQL